MKYLKLAAKIAKDNQKEDKRFDLGCVGIRKDGVVVSGTNVTTPYNRSPSQHAESRVIRKCGRGAVLFIARILKDGSWAQSKPCHNCFTLIKNMGIKKIYYTTGPKAYECLELN